MGTGVMENRYFQRDTDDIEDSNSASTMSMEKGWSSGTMSINSLSSCDTQVDAPSSLTRMSSVVSSGSVVSEVSANSAGAWSTSMSTSPEHMSFEDALSLSFANCNVDSDLANVTAMEQLKAPSCDLEVDTTTDEFRMYHFKVDLCNRKDCTDWNKCPYAHIGEKASRRDPRIHEYRPEFCQGLRKNTCPNGDKCVFSHSVFESWLHPLKYRTQLCKKALNCDREVCFFAHTEAELRHVPQLEPLSPPRKQATASPSSNKKRGKQNQSTSRKSSERKKSSDGSKSNPGNNSSSTVPAIPSQLLDQFKLLQHQATISQKAMEIYHAQRLYEAISLNNMLMQSGGIAPVTMTASAAVLASGHPLCQAAPAASAHHNPLNSIGSQLLPSSSQSVSLQTLLSGSNHVPSAASLNLMTPPQADATITLSEQEPQQPSHHNKMSQDYSPFLSPQLFDQSLYSSPLQQQF